MMAQLPHVADDAPRSRPKRKTFFGKKSKRPSQPDVDDDEGNDAATPLSASAHRRLRAVPRENSAVLRASAPRDPREEEAALNQSGRTGKGRSSPPREENLSGSGRRGRGKRAQLLAQLQQNSAVNVGAMARDPRLEAEGRHASLGRVAEDEAGNVEGLPTQPTPRRHKGRPKKTPPLAEYKIEDDPRRVRTSVNSAVDRHSLIRDPRLERDSFRRRSMDDDVGYSAADVPDDLSRSNHVPHPSRRSTVHVSNISHSSTHTSYASNEDNFDDEPMTRPSAPAGRRTTSRSTAFDVDQARASLMSRLRSDPSLKNNGRNDSASSEDFRSSLTDCLDNMGFDPASVQRAIEETNATSSDDAAKVVEWLGEHEGESKPRQLREAHSTDSGDETQYTKRSNYSNATTTTQESDENVQELKDSLRNLGFSKDVISRTKEMYRRHSREMDAETFIAAMLEVEDDRPPVGAEAEAIPRRPRSSSEAKKSSGSGRPDLIKSMSEMGFEQAQVENVIEEMQKAGSNVNADTVLGALLSGGGGGGGGGGGEKPEARRPMPPSGHRSQSVTEGSNRNLGGALRRDRSHRNTVFSSRPKPQDHEEASLSIEITPGQYAKLLKGRQTWNAMHDGTAVAADCIICNTTLQCTPEATFVLCPDCNVVSPLEDKGSSARRGSSERNVTQSGADMRSSLSRSASASASSVGFVGLGYKR